MSDLDRLTAGGELRPFSRGDRVEAALGLALMLAAIAHRFGWEAAAFAAGALLFVFGLWGRRIL